MAIKKYSIGMCKRYWKYFTVEAETEAEARSKAYAELAQDQPRKSVDGWNDYTNPAEITDCNET